LLHRRLDLEFAVDDAFHLQKKRGPKPERPGDEGKGKK
jgi:hypothetical protein